MQCHKGSNEAVRMAWADMVDSDDDELPSVRAEKQKLDSDTETTLSSSGRNSHCEICSDSDGAARMAWADMVDSDDEGMLPDNIQKRVKIIRTLTTCEEFQTHTERFGRPRVP